MLITSKSNPLIKTVSSLADKKFRRKTGLYLVEGVKSVKECIASGCDVRTVVCTEDHAPSFPEATFVSDSVFSAISCEKSVGVVYRKFGKNFSVKIDAGSFKTVHKLGIRKSVNSCGSVNTRNPKAAHIALSPHGGKNHKAETKNRKRKRNLRQNTLVSTAQESNVKAMIPYKG